jgi:AraC-like DNA-binding protein
LNSNADSFEQTGYFGGMSDEKYTGSPDARWYFWDGGFLAVGTSRGVIPTHSHHAVQLVVALEGTARVKYDEGEWQRFEAVMVAADAPHAYDGDGLVGVMLLIDPESREGRWLGQTTKEPIQAMHASRLEGARALTAAFRDDPPDAAGTAEFVANIVKQFGSGMMPTHTLDDRVVKAIDVIQEMDSRVVSLEDIAGKVYLSPSRFAHLFTDEVGIPFRRYLLWRRLTRAMLLASRGATLSRAAHSAGFSDAAHFTRTFYQMFGIPPSAMLGHGDMYEIPAPFQLARSEH